MANTNCDAVSGGSVAGGIFNLSDADLCALVLGIVPHATDVSPILVSSGTVEITTGEVWGVLTG
jgi:hypothetical protein